MRRLIKTIPESQNGSKLDQLCEEYWSFRKEHPLRYARVPGRIKLAAKSLLESGMATKELSSKLGVSAVILGNWLKSVGGIQVTAVAEVGSLGAELKEFSAEYRRSPSRSLPSSERREHTKKLGEATKRLIAMGASVEEIAAAVGVSHFTVRLWLKSLNEKLAESIEDEIEGPAVGESMAQPVSKAEVSAAAEPEIATPIPADLPTSKATITVSERQQALVDKPSSNDNDWIRIRIAGQILEVSWTDLLQKHTDSGPADLQTQPMPAPVAARWNPSATLPLVSEDDFNLLATEDGDMKKLVERYEALIMKNAIARHKTLGACANALFIARSTFDLKREKLGLK